MELRFAPSARIDVGRSIWASNDGFGAQVAPASIISEKGYATSHRLRGGVRFASTCQGSERKRSIRHSQWSG